MNKCEKIAYEYLKEQGYTDVNVLFRSHETPDFICSDGEHYEVKKLYKDKILIYESQLKKLDDKTNIIVVNSDKKQIVHVFKWKDRDKNNIFIPKISIIKSGDITTIKIYKSIALRLQHKKKHIKEDYNDILDRLLIQSEELEKRKKL